MDADRFLPGQIFDEFVASATKYRELWALGARRASVPADVVMSALDAHPATAG